MDPDLIRRFLAEPYELQKALKKINHALSNDSPVLKLVNTVSFYLISSVEEFDLFLENKKDKSLLKFSPEFFPANTDEDENEENDYEDEEEEEKVYGYEQLEIFILINAKSLDLYFEIDHKAVDQPSLSVDDLAKRLFKNFEEINLAEVKDKSHFRNSLIGHSLHDVLSESEDSKLLAWIHSDQNGKRCCEIGHNTNPLSEAIESRCTKAVISFQFLIPFFIDSGSKIDYEDQNWEYLLFFEDRKIVGFLSYYKFYVNFRNFKLRISQLFILPTHQKRGIGSKLIDFVYSKFLSNEQCHMITVEDPNNSFLNIQFRILIEKALAGAETNDLRGLLDFIENNHLTDLSKFDFGSLQRSLIHALKSGKNVVQTLLDAIILWQSQNKGKKMEFLPYIRAKIRQKLDADSKRAKGKETKKFLYFEGECLSHEEIKQAIESYGESEASDPHSIVQHRIEALEVLVKNLQITNN